MTTNFIGLAVAIVAIVMGIIYYKKFGNPIKSSSVSSGEESKDLRGQKRTSRITAIIVIGMGIIIAIGSIDFIVNG